MLPKKSGRKSALLVDEPCEKVESKILKNALSTVATLAGENGIEKELMLQKIVHEAIRSRDWDMSTFLKSLQIESDIPVDELTSLIYIANLSQRQYQMCRSFLLKYGIHALKPRNEIDAFKKTFYPSVTADN